MSALPDGAAVLHTAPAYPLARLFARMKRLTYVAVDVEPRPYVNLDASITDLPCADEEFDAVVSVHVLEHVADDDGALSELTRILKTGGWMAICVPIRLDDATYEDPAIQTPEQRYHAYGERTHERVYGGDLVQRLVDRGLAVQVERATETVSPEDRAYYGIREDEVLLLCTKR